MVWSLGGNYASLVGDGTTGSEGKSDRLGIATGSSDPGSGAAGDLYFNTGSSKLKYFDGTYTLLQQRARLILLNHNLE